MTLLKLTEEQIQTEIEKLSKWSVVDGKLHKDIEFSSFNEAFGFMTRASMEIEKMNHHPEWFNVYNKLTIDLMTHDAVVLQKMTLILQKFLIHYFRDL